MTYFEVSNHLGFSKHITGLRLALSTWPVQVGIFIPFNGNRYHLKNFLFVKLEVNGQYQELSHGYCNIFVSNILTWINPLDLEGDYSVHAVYIKMLKSAKYVSGKLGGMENHLSCVLVQYSLGI